ncbi:MAG: processing protein [Pseudonocardiales bacterium]|nr:processing protein [Pseudonocardiales bacterium]
MGGVSGVDEQVLVARAYLSRVAESADLDVWKFVREAGPVEAAAAIRAGRAPEGVTAASAARRESVDVAADLDAAEHAGIRLVVPESPDWPHLAVGALDRAADLHLSVVHALERLGRRRRRSHAGDPVPPLALWVRGPGDLASLAVRSVALVGARSATAYGERVTGELAFGLARREMTVVSGGAFGIDAAAHRGALGAEGVTVLVSAGGIDRPYPAGNAHLYERTAECGLLVSESPPGAAPHRRRFLTRNRLIAAFATGTVVVEAARRSGALNTAHHCRSLGRPLMAVPGPVTSAMSVGCHALLRLEDEPASLVTSVDDVLAVIGGSGEGLALEPDAGDNPSPDDPRTALDNLDPLARQVFEGLSARAWSSPDVIGRRSGIPVVEVIRALPALDLAGLLETSDGGYRVAPARQRR